MPKSFSSDFVKPLATAVVIIGSVMSTQTKTGTVPDLNQKSAIRINATTGVARIIASGSSKKLLVKDESPQAKPMIVPTNTVITKEIITRKKVCAKARQKDSVFTRFFATLKTLVGVGKMRGASMIKETMNHVATITTSESMYANSVRTFLIIYWQSIYNKILYPVICRR